MDKTSSQPEPFYESKYNRLDKTFTVTYTQQPLQYYNPVGLTWINFYETLFNKSSSTSILKELFRLSKASVRAEEAMWFLGEKAAMKVPSILLKRFSNKIGLQYQKIEAALTSKQDLQDFNEKRFLASLENETEMCIFKEECLRSNGEI